jgi:Family of unknown function (DUF6171)
MEDREYRPKKPGFRVTDDVKKERMEICKACEYLNPLKICKECGCFMPLKTWFVMFHCPKEKWR